MTLLQKMVLISQSTYDDLKYKSTTPQQIDTREQILYQPNINDEEKRIQFIDSWVPKKQQSYQSGQLDGDRWLDLLPVTYKKQGKFVLDQLRNVLDWNNSTGLLSINKQDIPGSNLVDVINYIVRPRKNIKPPTGWFQIEHLIKSLNLPREVSSNIHKSNTIGHKRPRQKDLTVHEIEEEEPRQKWLKTLI